MPGRPKAVAFDMNETITSTIALGEHLRRAGLPPETRKLWLVQMALVAVHGWDIMGAHRAGLTTGWASRLEGHFPPAMGAPDVSGANLVEVANGLLALG